MSTSNDYLRFPGTKDPDNKVPVTFKGPARPNDPVVGAAIVEVDDSQAVVDPSTFTFGPVLTTEANGYAWATCDIEGGEANPVVTPGTRPDPKRYLLRCRFTFASGQTKDKTLRLYVGHN